MGSGKTMLIESIVGHPGFFTVHLMLLWPYINRVWAAVSVVKEASHTEGATKRPLFLHMINSKTCEEPRITLKGESTILKDRSIGDK